jgi:hypothetical protein
MQPENVCTGLIDHAGAISATHCSQHFVGAPSGAQNVIRKPFTSKSCAPALPAFHFTLRAMPFSY